MPDKSAVPSQPEFLARFRIQKTEFEATRLDWNELCEIRQCHLARISALQTAAASISGRLRNVARVHSIRFRVKDPDRLVAKIIRKKMDDPGTDISVVNYENIITDLIGIRALHLFKDDWHSIDDFVRAEWDTAETPKAYIRAGDPDAGFPADKFEIIPHGHGYRSVHYLLMTRPAKRLFIAELQVRTLFEEAWSEIDHQMRYPNEGANPQLKEFLRIFNRLAGSADEMGTFIKNLSAAMTEQSQAVEVARGQIAHKDRELKKVISELKISNAEKTKLETKIAALTDSARQTDAAKGLVNLSPGWTGLLQATNAILSLSGTKKCTNCQREFTPTLLSAGPLCPNCQTSIPVRAAITK